MTIPAIKPQQGWNGICIDLQASIGLRAACRLIRTPRSVAIPDNHELHSFLPNDLTRAAMPLPGSINTTSLSR